MSDAPFFFGRERLVAQMVARLVGAPLLGVVGASGSGKSSALRAGLLAELEAGVLRGSERWTQRVIRPGERPLSTLGAPTDVLIVDQFEEVFSLCRDPVEREAFITALTGGDALVVVAVRSNFYGHCAAYPELAARLDANQVLVGPPARDELRRMIELPARAAGVQVEPLLVERLVSDIEGEPGALLLLSSARVDLWAERDGRRLTLQAYERSSGCAARSRGWPSPPTGRSSPPGTPPHAPSCCGWPARTARAGGCRELRSRTRTRSTVSRVDGW